MTVKRPFRVSLMSLVTLAVLAPVRPAGWAQLQTGSGGATTMGSAGSRAGHGPLDDEMDPHGNLPESYARMQNAERQRRLVNDTEKLLSLTNQLKASIARSGSEALTPEMLRQMDEIEKLARSVKTKMRN